VKIPLILSCRFVLLYEAIVGITVIHFVHRRLDLAQPSRKAFVADDLAALVFGGVGVTPDN
jgi:hypothetical protein